ncbi:MAG: hydroxymethylbilane synthase [Segetibacter sp.]|nr:hydroxymethylbilane synthase [Segetibacter sp.]
MQGKVLKIGTRESQLAVWQATQVKNLLAESGVEAELVYIKSEGDIDLQTPLYEMGVQGIFTRSLDIALLSGRIDLAVHSMKDVPTQLPKGILQAAVLKRASYKDLLVFKGDRSAMEEALGITNNEWNDNHAHTKMVNNVSSISDNNNSNKTIYKIATSSIRRKAQWLHRYPHHTLDNLRGNVNTRLRKVEESDWNGAIFAAAGLERIDLRPENSIELDWMLPAPAQGAIMVVCRDEDEFTFNACRHFHDADTAICTKVERDFLRALMGGCSTPISGLAEIKNQYLVFKGNILSVDGKQKSQVELSKPIDEADQLGYLAGSQILADGGRVIADAIPNGGEHA